MNQPRIVVAGAGVGGLACARDLQRNGFDVTVHEREAGPDQRWQGGMLDLHVATGQAALRAAGLFDEFRILARPEGQELRNLDPFTGTLVHHEMPTDDDSSAPEIDRGQLRGLLLDSLAPGTVRWGHPVTAVTPTDDGTALVRFGDAGEEADLVVGADGAWSRVRPAVSDAIPSYWGSMIIETYLDDVDARHPALADFVGPGTLVAKRGRTMLSAQRNSGGHVRVYAGLDAPLDWHVTARVDPGDDAELAAYLLDRLDGWQDTLLDLLRDRDGGLLHRPLYLLPVDHCWPHVPGVTLLGDAAHLMPPYGIGANLALIDGTDLAEAVADHPDLDGAVRAYETRMLPRSTAAAQSCAELTETLAVDAVHDVGAARDHLNRGLLDARNEH